MNITKIQVPIRDLVAGYSNNEATSQVRGYNGKLDIRPAYQREFVYDGKQQQAVIETIMNGFPLNTMYWVQRDDGTYEVLDGQQRTISICKYVMDKSFSILVPAVSDMPLSFGALQINMPDLANKILDYELDVYICSGSDSEKLAWFRVINTAGAVLTNQELRNATYAGAWLSSAKAYFSKPGGKGVAAADKSGAKSAPLLSGAYNRQDYLETALLWAADWEGQDNFADKDEWTIEAYMRRHQGDADASELWRYFSGCIEWVRSKFPNYRKEMKGLPWGIWYNQYLRGELKGNLIHMDAVTIEDKLVSMLQDDELEDTNTKDMYKYIIDGHETHLKQRVFDKKTAMAVYEAQDHKCPYCVSEGKNIEYDFADMDADHIIPWSKGGKTERDNCQMLCKHHNRSKGAK